MQLSIETLALIFTTTCLVTSYVIYPILNRIRIPQIEPTFSEINLVPIPGAMDYLIVAPGLPGWMITHAFTYGQQSGLNITFMNANELLEKFVFTTVLPNPYWQLVHVLFYIIAGLLLFKRFLLLLINFSHDDRLFSYYALFINLGLLSGVSPLPYITLRPLNWLYIFCRTITLTFLFIDNQSICDILFKYFM